MNSTKKVFVLKTYGSDKYNWSPELNDKLGLQGHNIKRSKRPYFCLAVGGSNGEDWITTYSYDLNISNNGKLEKLAYVECDYVE